MKNESLKKRVLRAYYEVVDPLEEMNGQPITSEYIELLTEISNHSARMRDGAVQTLFMEFATEKEDACEQAAEDEKEAAQRAFGEAIGELRETCRLAKCDLQVRILDELAEKMGFTVPTPETVRPEVVTEAVRRINLILGNGAASHEYQETINVRITDNRYLVFGTVDDTWNADVADMVDGALGTNYEPGIKTKVLSTCQDAQFIAAAVIEAVLAYRERSNLPSWLKTQGGK